jgi:hypothetical protein
MKCLRIHADEDGESHLTEVEIPLLLREVFPGALPFSLSARHKATSVQFVTHPRGLRTVDWHNAPERQLVIFLTGETEFETSDGTVHRIGPGSIVLAEDTWGKGHISRHPDEEQQVIYIPVPDGI